MKLLRRLVLLLPLCMGGAWIVLAFQPQPLPVDVAIVATGPLQVTVNEDGKTRLKERFVVSTPLAGRLRRVELKPGDVIEAGKTVLATILPDNPKLLDPRERIEAEARLRAAESAVLRAQTGVDAALAAQEIAATQHERTRKLHAGGSATEQQFEDAMLTLRTRTEEHRSAKFSLEIAQFERAQAQAALERFDPDADNPTDGWHFEIQSPISGRVLRVLQESAAVLPAGTPLIELGDPRNLELEIDVLSTDAVKIEAGDVVIVDQWGGAQPLRALVRVIEPSAFTKVSALGVEEQRVNVIADFDDPTGDCSKLGDGYRFEARIVVWEETAALLAPTAALFRTGQDWAVFVVEGDRARLQRVKLGHRNAESAAVLEGLAAGAVIVVYPSDRIEDGTLVVPRATANLRQQ